MACKRSAVRSRLAPPRFALRATRGAATTEPEGRSVVPGEASWRRRAGTLPKSFNTPLRATRGAATTEPEGRSVVPGEASWRRRAGETDQHHLTFVPTKNV